MNWPLAILEVFAGNDEGLRVVKRGKIYFPQLSTASSSPIHSIERTGIDSIQFKQTVKRYVANNRIEPPSHDSQWAVSQLIWTGGSVANPPEETKQQIGIMNRRGAGVTQRD
ncbi:hypothetical protein J6590_004652 [Homalodisca vitripennis]|nr:hypothetical protein J6590_004652 [Homalodisca vitripennis]